MKISLLVNYFELVKDLIIGNTPICIKALLPYALLATSNPRPFNQRCKYTQRSQQGYFCKRNVSHF